MRLVIRLLLAIVLTLAFVPLSRSQTPPQTQPVPGATQTPPRDAKAAKPATGVIRGRVVAADTGAPLRRARLVLGVVGAAAAGARTVSAITDAQGHYEFTELAAGRYTLTASKGSFVTLTYGQRRAFEFGKPIELADGAALEKIDFALPRGGVIAGTVTDELGEPVNGVRVMAMRSRYEQGKRKLVPVGRPSETNDLGQYRLYGLQPGSYYVGTQPLSGPLAALLSGGSAANIAAAMGDEGMQYPTCYYPGTLNAADAQRVTVRIGQERSGADFLQLPGRMARISGMVTDALGRPEAPTTVALTSTTNVGSMAMGSVKPDGSFTIPNVAPGEYQLVAAVNDPSGMQMSMVPVTVVGADIENLTISLSAGVRVAGRVVIEDGTSPSFPASGVKVNPQMVQSDIPTRMGLSSAASLGSIKEDWTFDWPGLGGSFLFRPTGLPSGYSLKAVLLDGRDITDTPLEVKGTEDITGLQVVVTNSTTQISGTPTDAKGQPAVDCSVIVFADDPARWKYPTRFVTTARPAQDGTFKIANLPPGRYLAIALDYVEEGQWQDPDYLESLRPLASMFTLAQGDTKTLNLKVTTPGS